MKSWDNIGGTWDAQAPTWDSWAPPRSYGVVVDAGDYHWTSADDLDPTYGLADPLVISWALPDDHRPQQPDPMVATFNLVVPSAADVDLAIGDPVTIKVTFGPSELDKPVPDIYFTGRIAQGDARAHQAGMLYQFTCADTTTDLAGYDIGADPYPVQAAGDRVRAMWAAAGLSTGQVTWDPVAAALDPDLWVETIAQPNAAQLLTSLIGLWDDIALTGAGALAAVNHRALIAPYPLNDGWALDVVPDAYVPAGDAGYPADFVDTFGEPEPYGLVLEDPDDRAAGVIDACVLDSSSDWAAVQPSVVTRAAVTWVAAPDTAGERTGRVHYTIRSPRPGGVPVTATRDTQVFSLPEYDPTWVAADTNAARMGQMMVPAPQNQPGWAPDSFTWLLSKDPIGLANFPEIFPRHDADLTDPATRPSRTAAYVRPIVVLGILDAWNAAATDWTGGQLAAVTLTIQDGEPVVEFQLTPTLPAQAPTPAAFTWADPALTPDVTWARVRPQPWIMYRLARSS